MSGGIAYLLDPEPAKVNPELVDLEALDADEVFWLGEVISSHAKLTGSRVAAALLADWPIAAVRFSRVMPRDYRRCCPCAPRPPRSGVDADEMIMEASHG